MSKLDRFLMSNGLLSAFPLISAICLDRHLSDHRPILLKEVFSDFGPTPFRFYHSWLELPGFDDLVSKSWNSFTLDDSNGMIRFKKKLQMLKKEIRAWTLDFKRHQVGLSKDLKSKLCDIDKVLDQGGVTDDILLSRLEVLKQLHDVQSSNNRDIMQKAKIRWHREGTRTPNNFMQHITKKAANLSVKGFLVDGVWGDIYLVNGSPTTEFHYYGLEQGNPLAPFLFLLIYGVSPLSFSRAVEAIGNFQGYMIDPLYYGCHHLFYVETQYLFGDNMSSKKDFGTRRFNKMKKRLSSFTGLMVMVLYAAFHSTWSSFITEVITPFKVKVSFSFLHCTIRVRNRDMTSSAADKLNTSISFLLSSCPRRVESQQLDQLSLFLDTVMFYLIWMTDVLDLNGDVCFQV
ncbi:hypothetical protein Tco_0407884 [Tanacetum coccineum]